MVPPSDEPFIEPRGTSMVDFPTQELFDGQLFGETPGIGWDTTDVFAQNMMDTIPSGGQMGLNLDLFVDLSGNNESGSDKSQEEELGLPLRLPSTVGATDANPDNRRLGNVSRHGSNDKLVGVDDDSPRGSLKSQQTKIDAFKTEVPQQLQQPLQPAQPCHALKSVKEKPRRSYRPRSTRPVRTKSLPKRLADANMTLNLPANHGFPHHPQESHDQTSCSTLGISAQSRNDPDGSGAQKFFTETMAPGCKRKHGAVVSPYGTKNANIIQQQKLQHHTSVVVSSKHPSSPQVIRATSTRTESRGKPSFAELVAAGMMVPGTHTFYVGQAPVVADVCDDGAIVYNGTRFRAVSKFALQVLRLRNPVRQSCDGWKEVSWNGEKLDKLRSRVAECTRMGRQRADEPLLEVCGAGLALQ